MMSSGTTLTGKEEDFRQREPRAGATHVKHLLGIADLLAVGILAHSLRGSQGGRVNPNVEVNFGR